MRSLILISISVLATTVPSSLAQEYPQAVECNLEMAEYLAAEMTHKCPAMSEYDFDRRLCAVATVNAYAEGLAEGGLLSEVEPTGGQSCSSENDLLQRLYYAQDELAEAERKLERVQSCLAQTRGLTFNKNLNSALSNKVIVCAVEADAY